MLLSAPLLCEIPNVRSDSAILIGVRARPLRLVNSRGSRKAKELVLAGHCKLVLDY